jgi:radical SAM protein with 4Fe4S-binding SPASM domain
VTFVVTQRCNYRCTHCYQEHQDQDELSTDEVVDILEQLAQAGVLFLTLMGGEFFMRPDANEILAKAHELGFALKVLTTGHHITDKRAEFLATLRPLQIDISIYGSKPAIHEEITNQQGSWERSTAAIRRLVARKIPVVLKTPVMDNNVSDLEDIAAMARELGARFTFDPKLTAVENGDLETTRGRMNQEQLANFYGNTMAEFVEASYGDIASYDMHPLGQTPCRAGQDICSINPSGEVWPCNSLPMPVGSLKTHSFAEIWSGSAQLEGVRTLKWASIQECNECPVRSYCTRCHGMAHIEDGNMKGPSLEACRHAVAIRDSLREAGKLPATETQLPPTWDRVSADGQHDRVHAKGKRALRVIG